MQRRHHYEAAFEHWLREQRRPYVAVHEARKTLLPAADSTLKSFDFVLYGEGLNLLADIKGRRIGGGCGGRGGRGGRHLESWATEEDVGSLLAWERLFGNGFAGVLIFLYWCDAQPPAPLCEEVFEYKDRWYAVRVVRARDYARIMKPRSPRWRTVHVPAAAFDRACTPLGVALDAPAPHGPREIGVHSRPVPVGAV